LTLRLSHVRQQNKSETYPQRPTISVTLNRKRNAGDEACGQLITDGSTTMLAEIFLLNLQNQIRNAAPAPAARDPRFVPIAPKRA